MVFQLGTERFLDGIANYLIRFGLCLKISQSFIHLHISSVLLYCYYLSLVSIGRLAKSFIFLSLINRDPTLGA